MEKRIGFLRQVLDKTTRSGQPYVCFLLEEMVGVQTWINLFDASYMRGRVGAESDFDIHEWMGERLSVLVEPSEDGQYLCCKKISPLQEDPHPFQTARTEIGEGLPDKTGSTTDSLAVTDTQLSGAQETEVDRVVLRSLERAGLRHWVAGLDLSYRVQQNLGVRPSLGDILRSARRIWTQLDKQEAIRTIEYDMEQDRCRLIKKRKNNPKKEETRLWTE